METSLTRHTAAGPLEFTPEQRQMIRATFANGASDAEFAVLMEIARARRLNPLLRQIHFVRRWNGDGHVWAPQVSIDGLRAIAERTGLYAGQDEPEFVENPDGSLKLCKVRVYRKDWERPVVGVAYWTEYVQTTRDKRTGEKRTTEMWAKMPHVMLAKVAESIALRKAFAEDMGDLHTDDEMAQANNDAPAPPQRNARRMNGGPRSPELTPGVIDVETEPARPASYQAFAAALAAAQTLSDVGAVWQEHCRALADDDAATQAAQELVATWLDERRHALVTSEVNRVLARTCPEPMLALLDALASQATPEAVVAWYLTPEIRAGVEALEQHDRDGAKLAIARTWCARAGMNTTRPRAAFAAALQAAQPQPAQEPAAEPPPDDARGRAEEAHHELHGEEVARAAQEAAPEGPQPFRTSKGTLIDGPDAADSYARAITAIRHVQSASRRYGHHEWMAGPLARRLAELAAVPQEAAVAQVASLAAEGPTT